MMTGPGDEKAAGGSDRGHLRASQADREQVIAALRAAFIQGRLTRDEFDLRLGRALGAWTCVEVAALTATFGRSGPAGHGSQATIYVAYDIAHGVKGSGAVIPINTATNQAGKPIKVNTGQITINPDGKIAYAVNEAARTVIPISTAINTPGQPIRVAPDDLFLRPPCHWP